MKREDAIDVAKTIYMSNGDIAFIQSDGQIRNPHQHGRNDPFAPHVDGWAVRYEFGSYEAAKIHSDDFERGVTPDFRAFEW